MPNLWSLLWDRGWGAIATGGRGLQSGKAGRLDRRGCGAPSRWELCSQAVYLPGRAPPHRRHQKPPNPWSPCVPLALVPPASIPPACNLWGATSRLSCFQRAATRPAGPEEGGQKSPEVSPQDPVPSRAAEKAHPQSSHVSLHDRQAMWGV